MTLAGFVHKNALRNPRRSVLTVVSIAFSMLLLTLMMTIWQRFYVDQERHRPRSGCCCGTRSRWPISYRPHTVSRSAPSRG